MAGSFKLNDTDLKSALIAVVIAAGGALYWRYKKGGGTASNLFNSNANIQSAASGSAGAIAPSSSINTYNVFPTVSSQQGTPNQFFNGNASNATPSSTHTGNSVWLSNGQGFSLPIQT